MSFLEHVVTKEGISVDPSKVEVIVNWPKPFNVIMIRNFLGLGGYYRLFVNGFSSLTTPLLKLNTKNIKIEWSDEC